MLKKDTHKIGTSVLTPIVKDRLPPPPPPPPPESSDTDTSVDANSAQEGTLFQVQCCNVHG